jgi:hypothetical protein
MRNFKGIKMKNKHLYIQTFGCQMNVHDSEQMASILSAMGYECTDNMMLADLIILNTCSIREKAAQKVYSKLGRIGKLKKLNPELIILILFSARIIFIFCLKLLIRSEKKERKLPKRIFINV